MALIGNVKDFIYEYSRYVHLDQMPAAVRARFRDYERSEDFAGHMKDWPAIFRDLDSTPSQWPTLSDNDYKKLFNLFQPVFEDMAQSLAKDREPPKAVKSFVDRWYGASKLFTRSAPLPDVKDRIDDFATYLDKNKDALRAVFTDKNLGEGFDFSAFVTDLKSKKYLTDFELRKQLKYVANYIQNIASGNNWYDWPDTLQPYDFSQTSATGLGPISTDVDEWFVSNYNRFFPNRLPELFGELIGNKKVFEYFQSKDIKGTISKNIKAGIEGTNYADEKSDDFVPEKDTDAKNFWQRADDKINKIKENQIDPWANILRGTRRFFSQPARTIIEACSKVKNKDGKKLKPTDGLKGILGCKDDIAKKVVTSPKAREQWKWISERLSHYSTTMPYAFEGAFRNSRQLRKIVSQFIIDGVKDNKIDATKTALEMLSTLKYGVMHSRVMDALQKEDFTWLSHKDLSWNKYEGARFVTTALDKTLKYTMIGVGRGIVAIRNRIMRARTKFNGKYGDLKNAHDLWLRQNAKGDFDTKVVAKIDADVNQARTDRRTARANLLTAGGATNVPGARSNLETALGILRTDNETDKADRADKKKELDRRNAQLSAFGGPAYYLTNIDTRLATIGDATTPGTELGDKTQEKTDAETRLINLQNAITQAKNDLNSIDPNTDPDLYNKKLEHIKNFTEDVDKVQASITQLDSEITALNDEKTQLTADRTNLSTTEMTNLQNEITNLDTDIANRDTDIANKQKVLDDFANADKDVKELLRQQAELHQKSRDWEQEHKDKYLELMAFWDMCETFSKSHQFTFAANKMRDKFLTKDSHGIVPANRVAAQFLTEYRAKHP